MLKTYLNFCLELKYITNEHDMLHDYIIQILRNDDKI